METTQKLTIGPNEPISIKQSLFLGLQHVLAMDVYVVPFIIATAVSASADQATALIQSCFLGAGIASLIQVLFFLKLPVCQGPSFVPVGAIIGLYFGNGNFNNVFGASLVGGLILAILGVTGIIKKVIAEYIPRIVSGTIIMIVGLSLLPAAFNSNIYVQSDVLSMHQNILLAVISGSLLIVFSMIGYYAPKTGNLLRIGSVILAIAIGTVVAALMGGYNFDSVTSAGWFTRPMVAFVDYPLGFDLSSILTMLIIYLVLTAETTGTWYAVSSVIDETITDHQLNMGIIGEGIGCMIAALVGATPVTGYSTNAGIISVTGVASKRVFVGASIWFIILSFLGKFSALINSIPSSVIGGIFSVVTMIILLAGFKVIKEEPFDERQTYIVGLPIIVAMGLIFLPVEVKQSAPTMIQYLLDSPIAISAIISMLMNKLLPEI